MDLFVDSLLERLFATSVQTAVVATAVWLLCRSLPRLSPSSQCWLWWLVALQALLGLVVSPIELSLLPQAPAALVEVLAPAQLRVVPDTMAAAPVPDHPTIRWQSAVFLLWLAGLLIMTCFTLLERRRGMALLADSLPCNDEGLLQSLFRASEGCHVPTPKMRISYHISSPVLIGHRTPVLLLPPGGALSGEELDMALAHELTHLRRGDLWWGLIPTLARHLFFFHPFAHLAVREYGTAREAACDAAVVASEQRSRLEYGRLIVRLGTTADSRAGLAVASPTFRSLSRRLTMLQNTSFLSRAGSIAVLTVAAFGVLPLRLVAAAGEPASTAIPAATVPPGAQRFGSSEAQKFLAKQIVEAERLLREEEARIAEFKRRNLGFPPAGEGGDFSGRLAAEMAGQKAAENNLVQARTRLSELQKQANVVQAGVRKSVELGTGGSTEDALDVTQRKVAAEDRLRELRVRFKDTWPEIVEQIRVVEDLKKQEEQELADLKRNNGANALHPLSNNPAWQSIQIELNKVQLEIATLNSVIQAHRKEISKLSSVTRQAPEMEQQYRQLMRNYEVHKAQYEQLRVKSAQFAVTDAATRRDQAQPAMGDTSRELIATRDAEIARLRETVAAQRKALEAAQVRDTERAAVVTDLPPPRQTVKDPRSGMDRKRELLEGFALDSLKMVGTMLLEDRTYGLVKAPDNKVHKVLPGNYLGRNQGRITRIDRATITVTETVPDERGGYMERSTRLYLSE